VISAAVRSLPTLFKHKNSEQPNQLFAFIQDITLLDIKKGAAITVKMGSLSPYGCIFKYMSQCNNI